MAKSFASIPGPRGISALVNFSPFGKHNFERMHLAKRENFNKYGHIYRERLGPGINIVQIFNPDDVATIFRADEKFPLRPAIPIVTTANKRDGFALGLGALNGAEWYRLRSAVQKLMMRPRSAAAYLPAQNQVADKFLKLVHESLNDHAQLDDFAGIILKYTMESIGVVCFGQEMGCLEREIRAGSEAEVMVRESARLFHAVQRTTFAFPWHALFRTTLYKQFVDAKTTCDRVATRHIDAALKEHNSNPINGPSECPHFLSTLLNADRLTPQELVGITTDLFTAGIDSTANALSFIIYNLSRNPDKQEKLWFEISSVLKSRRDITANDFDSLPYLKAAVKESFRLNFPVEGGTTRILSQDVIVSGYQVPKNTIIAFNNQTMCVGEEYFEWPESYIPERWMKDGSATTKRPPKFVMLPFGYGPRMCIGRRFAEQEIYLALIKLLQAFQMDFVGTEEVGMINRVFTMPDKPIALRFTPR